MSLIAETRSEVAIPLMVRDEVVGVSIFKAISLIILILKRWTCLRCSRFRRLWPWKMRGFIRWNAARGATGGHQRRSPPDHSGD